MLSYFNILWAFFDNSSLRIKPCRIWKELSSLGLRIKLCPIFFEKSTEEPNFILLNLTSLPKTFYLPGKLWSIWRQELDLKFSLMTNVERFELWTLELSRINKCWPFCLSRCSESYLLWYSFRFLLLAHENRLFIYCL